MSDKFFNISLSNYSVYQKRLLQPLTFEEVPYIAYGGNNLYPQVMNELRLRSPLVKSATKVLSDFINGEGWTNNGEEVVNDFGENWNDILNYASDDVSNYGGFALLIDNNARGNDPKYRHIPFEFVRFAQPNNEGMITSVYVSNNWERDSLEKGAGRKIINLPMYNPLTAGADALEGNAQVLYWTPKMFKYPLTTYDAVADSAQVDGDVQVFELSTTQTGFMSSTIFVTPEMQDDEQRIKMLKKLEDMQGANGSRMMHIEADEDYDITNKIVNIPALNNDRIFEQTIRNVTNRILQNYAMPREILGVPVEGGVINQQAIKDGYVYYNLYTGNMRKQLERVFSKLNPNLGKIKPNMFVPAGMVVEEEMNRRNNEPEEETPQVNQEIENLLKSWKPN